MNDKLKLFEMANKSIEQDAQFMAFFLKRYLELEKLSQQDICSELKCSIQDYYKLSMCKAPDPEESDYLNRLNKINQYTNASVFALNKIIKRVNTIIKLSGSMDKSYLMAARDKKTDSDSKGS